MSVATRTLAYLRQQQGLPTVPVVIPLCRIVTDEAGEQLTELLLSMTDRPDDHVSLSAVRRRRGNHNHTAMAMLPIIATSNKVVGLTRPTTKRLGRRTWWT